MLYFTRWKALAIILTALVVCLCAVPNFFPEATVKGWPKWAQITVAAFIVVIAIGLLAPRGRMIVIAGRAARHSRHDAGLGPVREPVGGHGDVG